MDKKTLNEEYRDKVKKLVGENGADFDDAPAYISPSMKQFDIYDIDDTKLLQQISSTGNTMQDVYQGKVVISTSSHMAFVGKEGAELPMFEMGGSTIKDWYESFLLSLPPSYLSTHVGARMLSDEQFQSIIEELKAIADEGLLSTEGNDEKGNHEVTATKLCEEYKRCLLYGFEPDSSAIGTSDLVYGELCHYLTNEAMTEESRKIVIELIKSRVHHDMETGDVVVIDTMPELTPSLESFDDAIEDEDRYTDKPLLPYELTRSGKAKKFAVRGGKMVPTGQYPKFMTNPKHNKKQRRKK